MRGQEPSTKREAGLGVQVWPTGMLEPAMKRRGVEVRRDHKEQEPSVEHWNRHWALECGAALQHNTDGTSRSGSRYLPL